MNELKPCPFCGQRPTWHIGGYNDDILLFGCRDPNSCVRWSVAFTKPYYENALNIAVENWNRRADT